MKNRKIGIGSISLLLVIIAFFWAFEINGICLGDAVLSHLGIPTWSNDANASGTHYTVFYTFIFLIPALIISLKYKEDKFAKAGKILSIIYLSLLILSMLFMGVYTEFPTINTNQYTLQLPLMVISSQNSASTEPYMPNGLANTNENKTENTAATTQKFNRSPENVIIEVLE